MNSRTTRTVEYKRRYVERLLAGISPENRLLCGDFLRAKEAEGLRASSLQNHAVTLSALDRHANGGPIKALAPEQLRDFLLTMTRTASPATVWGHAARLRHFYRHLTGTDLKPELKAALKRRAPRNTFSEAPITDHEFRALVEAANGATRTQDALRTQAMLWVLWDSGFRLGELLALTVGSVEFDNKGGGRLRLPAPRDGLKTDNRTIYVVECTAPLRAWLSVHPSPGDPDAALFPGNSERPKATYWPENINMLIKRLCLRAGIRPMHPHLFRHTRATRAARAGWTESQMRPYFGWSPTSDMPAHYIHLAESDRENQVRRDAGIDENGFRLANANVDDAALESRMKKALRRMLLEDSG